jgi:hypothetical protein
MRERQLNPLVYFKSSKETASERKHRNYSKTMKAFLFKNSMDIRVPKSLDPSPQVLLQLEQQEQETTPRRFKNIAYVFELQSCPFDKFDKR